MEKKKNNLFTIFKDDKKRHIATLIVILPFLIIIGFCGFKIYQQAKDLIGSFSGNESATNANYSINNNSIVLRSNATAVQKELFAELKTIYENPSPETTDKDKAASTVKNFVADFFTWSNKQGQYDVGGTYYLFSPQRNTIYIQARDQFYKYINQHINKYGVENLLEVETVEAEVKGDQFSFMIDESEYGAFIVNANWTYVLKETEFNTSSYDTSASFVVIDNNGRFEIAYMGSKEYQANEQE